MSHPNAPAAVIHMVTRHRTVGGVTIRRHDIPGPILPWRISRRMNACHALGLDVVRGLGASGDVIAVAVSDGTRTMAQWRLMDGMGFTGTTDAHPMTPRKVRWTPKGWK